MASVQYEPLRDLMVMQDRMNRLFNQTFGEQPQGNERAETRTWAPPADIYETANGLVLKLELPGIDPSQVDIQVRDNSLYLEGERKPEGSQKDRTYHRIERPYGTFGRSFTLPAQFAADKVEAKYSDGLLILTVPKREESKPKSIKINVSN